MTPPMKVSAVMMLGVLAAMPAVATLAWAAADAAPAANAGHAPVVQRITADQYRNIVTSVFGADISLGGRFEPEVREGGLLQIGAAQASVTAAGFEQYHNMARTIAAQVVDARHRDYLIPCKPRSDDRPDAACAAKFIGESGRLLFRRALTKQELRAWTNVATTTAESRGSFYDGLAFSLSGMLQSPNFLFRQERVVRDSEYPGQYRLDAYSKASKLSFLAWNAAPDAALLAAAEAGRLDRKEDLGTEVERLLTSPRAADGVRAFFSDMLHLDNLSTLSKDSTLFPNFTPDVVAHAKEQMLRTIVDVVVDQNGDYRDVYTTRRTFLTPLLGSIYRVPIASDAPNGGTPQWQAHEYQDGDPRAGILAQISFVSLHSHAGRTSPTLRGKAVREMILCQKVPDPPGEVSFDIIQDTTNPRYRTTRARMEAHLTNPVCAGCHKLTDPLGFPLETFDSDGTLRATENGVPIDTSGSLGRVSFSNAVEFSRAVANDPAASSCLVGRLYAYAMGRSTGPANRQEIADLTTRFVQDGYRVLGVMRSIATSDAFFRAAPPVSVARR